MKAHRALGRFREGAPFRPWLLAIVANEARNRRRSAARRARFELHLVEERPSADAAPSPEAALLAREQRARLLARARDAGGGAAAGRRLPLPARPLRARDRGGARLPARHRQVAPLARARATWRRSCERARDPPRRARRRVAARARRGRARARARGGRAAAARAPRVAACSPTRRLRPAVAVPLALLVLAAGGVAAVPSARSAVLRWLGIEGVKIERVPVAPTPAPTPRRRSTSASASPLARGALVPRALGRPDAVYADGDHVTLLYRPRRGCRSPSRPAPARCCRSSPAARTRSSSASWRARTRRSSACAVDGEPGFWLAGDAHGAALRGPLRRHPRGARAARRPDPGLAARRAHAAPRGRRHQVAGARDRPLRPMRREPTMQRTLVLAAVAALALAVAPAAAAKEITKAEVCGADGCRRGGQRGTARSSSTAARAHAADRRAVLHRAVRGRHRRQGARTLEMTAVPERHALRAEDGTWMEMPPDAAALSSRSSPRAARRFPGATRPDGRRAAARAGAGDRRSPLYPAAALLRGPEAVPLALVALVLAPARRRVGRAPRRGDVAQSVP